MVASPGRCPESTVNLSRPFLAALVLATPATALADRGFLAGRILHTVQDSFSPSHSIRYAQPEDGALAAVTVRVQSDGGEEEVRLVESDASLHGAATIAALPARGAELTFTVYDATNTSLMSFSGTLGADGIVTLTAGVTLGANPDCSSRTGCPDDETREVDVELSAAEVFAAPGGYDLGFDLAGVDTYGIAYAEIVVIEPGAGVCTARVCDDPAEEPVTTTAEVYWDEIGTVWEGVSTLEHDGLVELKVTTRDAEGRKLETTKSTLGLPWLDGGEGVNTLGTDEDPLTTIALLAGGGLVVVSEGWTLGDAIPTHAEVALTDGETITIAANSYQRLRKRPELLFQEWDTIIIDDHLLRGSGGGYRTYLKLARNGSPEPLMVPDVPQCTDGFCMTVSELDEGGYQLSVTAYGGDASALPDDVEITATLLDEFGEQLAVETVLIALDDEVTAVFANEVLFVKDPVGLDVSGKVKLLGDADRKGRRDTLAKGRFYGSFSRDGDGDLALSGMDKDRVSAWDTAFVAGESNALVEVGSDDNGDGVITGPPVVQSSLYSRLIGVPRKTVYQLSVENGH
jgi:hypothetical protein